MTNRIGRHTGSPPYIEKNEYDYNYTAIHPRGPATPSHPEPGGHLPIP